MSEITEIASTVSQTREAQLQEQANVRILKMALQAEKDMAKMLFKNIEQIQELPDSAKGHIDIYV